MDLSYIMLISANISYTYLTEYTYFLMSMLHCHVQIVKVNVFSLLQSIINVQNQPVERDQDKCKTFLQKYEQKIRHFGE